MRLENIQSAASNETVWAVVLGAFLATISGFFATQLEAYLRRRERERNSALLFGEVLSTLHVILKFAGETRLIGDPYGPVTMRMLRAARREIDVYDRNREALYELRDAVMRTAIHIIIVRLTMAIDGIFDTTQEIAAVQAAAVRPGPAERDLKADEERLKRLTENRDAGFDFTMETAKGIKPIIAGLGPIARHSFDSYEKAVSATQAV